MNFRLSYIASAVGGRLSNKTNAMREIGSFFTDSRTPSHDKLFLALRGERVDGNSFVPALVAEGYCVMTDREENLSLDGDVIYVSDVRNALQELARYYRLNELSEIPFVGITGSVGKTTTKEMVSLALSSSKNVHKTLGNFNSQIGLPQTVLACEKNADIAVVELGMSMPGEMEKIARCAVPNISIITNIGYSHIENLGSREAICDEKLKIASFSDENSSLILNGDEPLLRSAKLDAKNICYVSVENRDCDCYAKNIKESLEGIEFVAVIFEEEFAIKLPVCGRHFVINSLFALATAKLLGLDLQKAADALSNYESDGKRQYVYNTNGHTVISDCYNASPESMKAALSVLASSKGRRIAVLGDMLELGNESENLHRLVGSYVSNSADVLVTYGEMAEYIAKSADLKEAYSFSKSEREKLNAFLKEYIKEGDTVLYKASNGMNLDALIV